MIVDGFALGVAVGFFSTVLIGFIISKVALRRVTKQLERAKEENEKIALSYAEDCRNRTSELMKDVPLDKRASFRVKLISAVVAGALYIGFTKTSGKELLRKAMSEFIDSTYPEETDVTKQSS